MSPYLLQHAHNPVNWYPWGDEAFAEARKRNVPLLVSIGYAACHWCHVMERECFEDEEIAAYMNAHFVCIKVDREERPDVDHMYMDAVQAISGSGGWPLNAFATTEGIPFYGGTYYPPRPAYNRPSWPALLERITHLWNNQRDELDGQAQQLMSFLKESVNVDVTAKNDNDAVDPAVIATGILSIADLEHGGFGNAPKFPGSMAINFLLHYSQISGNTEASHAALLSLNKMAAGGIYDQIGGGFARYATDRKWFAPHFEKMLYDNGLLITSYANAYKITADDNYIKIITETITFLNRELRDSTGGYYCALDADSEGVEGKFYTWTNEEWNAALGEQAQSIANYFGVTATGNWEHTNILFKTSSVAQWALENGYGVEEAERLISTASATLLAARNKKIRPATDDKALLSWNALIHTALCHAAAIADSDEWEVAARQHMLWMTNAFVTTNNIGRVWKNGLVKIEAKLDDLAYFIQSLIEYASLSGDQDALTRANALTERVIAQFSKSDGYFYFTPESQQDIPMRKTDLYDGALPSANSVMAHNLLILGICMEQPTWILRAKGMIHNMAARARNNGYSYSYWAQLLLIINVGYKVVVCTGKEAVTAHKILRQQYLPHVLTFKISDRNSTIPILKNKFSEDNLSIFVCTEWECLAPQPTVNDAINALKAIFLPTN